MPKQKGINPNAIHFTAPKEKYADYIKYQENGREWEHYADIIRRFTAELLGIKKEEAVSKMAISPEWEKVFSEISAIANDSRPKLELQPAYVDMEEFINFFKKQEYGYMGIAHPGLINMSKALIHPEESVQSMLNLFKNFKEKGGERALCAELYYHYFGALARSPKWLNSIENYARAENLAPSGGLDTHGRSIFYSG